MTYMKGRGMEGPEQLKRALGKHFSFFSIILFDTNEYFIAFIGIILQLSNGERSEASTSHHCCPH